MPNAEKIAKVEELISLISMAKAIYLADYTGIDVTSVTVLRSKLREVSVKYLVVKNRLAKRAVQKIGIPGLEGFFTGPTAIVFAKEDPVIPAKILQDFIDGGGKLAIKTGYVDDQLLSREQFKMLAKLPSREQLLTKLISNIKSPFYGLEVILNGLLIGLVRIIIAVQKQQQKESEEIAA